MTAAEATALPASGQAVDRHIDAGAFFDHASALIRRSWSRDAGHSMSQVLASWRLAERDLDSSTPGSEAWNDASLRFLAARSEYRHLFDLAAVHADTLRRSG